MAARGHRDPGVGIEKVERSRLVATFLILIADANRHL